MLWVAAYPDNNPMDDSDLTYDQLVDENNRLKKAVGELSIINELSQAISGSLDSEKIIRNIISRSIKAIQAEQGDISLVAENRSDPSHTLVRSIDHSGLRSPVHLNQNLLGWMQINKKPLLINDPENDTRFRHVKWGENVRSLVCAPLMVKSNLIGILTLYNKKNSEGFDESDKRLLSIIASQSAQVIENARLYEEEKELNEIRTEMEMASAIQKAMLPSAPPELEDYRMCGHNLTAKMVGGDYFDFIKVSEEEWIVCLGDISGKGIAASLLMSNLQAILRGQAIHLQSPSEILKHANTQLFYNTSPEKFATLFLGFLNTKNHTFRFSSAGHEYPFLLKPDGSSDRLIANGLPLGVLESSEYEDNAINITPGTAIFVYSDGITDCVNANEEPFGEPRLQSQLFSAGEEIHEPQSLIETIFNDCFSHMGSESLFDDMTALALCRKP